MPLCCQWCCVRSIVCAFHTCVKHIVAFNVINPMQITIKSFVPHQRRELPFFALCRTTHSLTFSRLTISGWMHCFLLFRFSRWQILIVCDRSNKLDDTMSNFIAYPKYKCNWFYGKWFYISKYYLRNGWYSMDATTKYHSE